MAYSYIIIYIRKIPISRTLRFFKAETNTYGSFGKQSLITEGIMWNI